MTPPTPLIPRSRSVSRSAVLAALIIAAIAPAGRSAANQDVRVHSAMASSSPTEPAFTTQTFIYKSVGDTALRADVFRVPAKDRRPVLLWLHPGALIMGSRAMLPADERERFLRAGFIVVAVDYRLAPETKLAAILDDIDDAHRWVRSKGPALFGADPARIAAVGASAGGYLALMAGARVRPRLKAVVSLYGYGDVAGQWYSRPDPFYVALPRVTREAAYRGIGQEAISVGSPRERNDFYVYCRQKGLWSRKVVGFDPEKERSRFAPYSAERLVAHDYPPTLLIHGDRDVDVPFRMSERMAAVLAREHVEHELIRMEGFNHAFDVFSDFPPRGTPTGLRTPRVIEAFDSVIAFLMKHVSN